MNLHWIKDTNKKGSYNNAYSRTPRSTTNFLANVPISSGVEKWRRPVGFPLNFPLPAPDPMIACPRPTAISITTVLCRTLPKLRHQKANPTKQGVRRRLCGG